MKIFFDTEFREYAKITTNSLPNYTEFKSGKNQTDTIELISIGLVDENGRELYLISNEFNQSGAWSNEWLRENVCKKLDNSITDFESFETYINMFGKTRKELQKLIIDFCGDKPEFWTYYGSYDWVTMCWIFGRMIDLPEHFPKFTMDLMQAIVMYDIDKTTLKNAIPQDNCHNALDDAKWNKAAWEYINKNK